MKYARTSTSADQIAVLPRVERERCRCGVMMADCLVPVGNNAVPACWVCAHDYVEHDRPIGGGTSGVPCACRREDIYPPDVIESRAMSGTPS